ncbi:hypothetical protein G6F46_014554 [Rhizopus delemar]|nr:hypothetical protein G6F46_014554 [Rhizopus delemar]
MDAPRLFALVRRGPRLAAQRVRSRRPGHPPGRGRQPDRHPRRARPGPQADCHRLALRHRHGRRPFRRHHRRPGRHRSRAHDAGTRHRTGASVRSHRLPVRRTQRLRHLVRGQPRALWPTDGRHAGRPQPRRRDAGPR